MSTNPTKEKINIRPGVSILSILRHLNYRPWFAMAEFVDNSIQSFIDYKKELIAQEGSNFKLEVAIEIDPTDRSAIYVRDNATGMKQRNGLVPLRVDWIAVTEKRLNAAVKASFENYRTRRRRTK